MGTDPTIDPTTNLLYQKLAVGFSTLVISLAFGLLPYHLSRPTTITSRENEFTHIARTTAKGEKYAHNNNGSHSHHEEDPTMLPKWLSLATSFGGGVFLGAALLHLLPDASDILDGDGFPRANLLCSLGFMMVLALEDVMPHASEANERDAKSTSSSVALVAALSFHSLFDGLAIGSVTSSTQLKAVSIAILAHKPISAFALGSVLVCKRMVMSQSKLQLEIGELEQSLTLETPQRKMKRRQSPSRRSMAYYYFKYAHDECESETCPKKECVCNDLMRWGNGIVGAAPYTYGGTEVEDIRDMSSCDGYGSCEGTMELSRIQPQNVPIPVIFYIVFFSTTSLVGTAIGAFALKYIEDSEVARNYEISSSSSAPQLGSIVAAVCQSVAAGSFVYAATMEALVKERGEHHRHHFHNHHEHQHEHDHHGIQRTNRVVAALAGVIAMSAIKMLED
ncbi:hypothetical protein HJC23_005121 [Cyclotella cryptica]|uniref:Uncharacterized protein n=1 Tax=Cyclotella cryptica TaxID=29204 RepID=A0ABD3QFM1_9STRA|eukprot:CCRYP_005807-RB/>CCRYP_005807-RB protein AED:0.00 eAED:0.00 QI:174/-1/1/1/-1/1/1/71/449